MWVISEAEPRFNNIESNRSVLLINLLLKFFDFVFIDNFSDQTFNENRRTNQYSNKKSQAKARYHQNKNSGFDFKRKRIRGDRNNLAIINHKNDQHHQRQEKN